MNPTSMDAVRAVLAQIGGLHPATEPSPTARPWLTESGDQIVVSLLVLAGALPALPRLLTARRALAEALGRDVRLHVIDIVAEPPQA